MEHGCRRFLFDMRDAIIEGTTMGAYETVVDHERYGVEKQFRVAAVYLRVTEQERFMEDVGVDRGAVAYRVFGDIEAARRWVAGE